MNSKNQQVLKQDELAADPVWDLLRKSPAVQVSPQFADRVLRAVRQQESPQPWWERALLLPIWMRASAAAALVAISCALFYLPKSTEVAQISALTPVETEVFSQLDEVASQELLLVATDHLNEFSDSELVTLIGF